jgi:hypothetical protein
MLFFTYIYFLLILFFDFLFILYPKLIAFMEDKSFKPKNHPEGNSQDCPFLFAHNPAKSTDQINKNSCPVSINKDDNPQSQEIEAKKCLFVELKEEANYLNLSSFYLVQFSYVCFFSFMDIMQPHLLEEGKFADANKDNEITINTDLVFYDNLYLALFIYIFGAFQDVLGRKLVISGGFFILSVALFLYPYAERVYPTLLLLRLLFSNGICAVVTQPLLADYVKHTSKGFCGGISAFLSGCGALFAVFVLLKLRSVLSIQYIYVFCI